MTHAYKCSIDNCPDEANYRLIMNVSTVSETCPIIFMPTDTLVCDTHIEESIKRAAQVVADPQAWSNLKMNLVANGWPPIQRKGLTISFEPLKD